MSADLVNGPDALRHVDSVQDRRRWRGVHNASGRKEPPGSQPHHQSIRILVIATAWLPKRIAEQWHAAGVLAQECIIANILFPEAGFGELRCVVVLIQMISKANTRHLTQLP